MASRGFVHLTRQLVAALALGSGAASGAWADDYMAQPGDILEVSVWKEEGLQREVLVRPDGRISFPLAGEIDADGKSIQELQQELVERLGRYIPEPVVTVTVNQVLGNKIYVIGKVNKPGEFVVTQEVDVVKALSMAGGLSTFADSNEVKVLRRTDGEQAVFPFNYGELEEGRGLEQNIILQSGDVVIVP
jgi:polysaccharide export outer membrane protein